MGILPPRHSNKHTKRPIVSLPSQFVRMSISPYFLYSGLSVFYKVILWQIFNFVVSSKLIPMKRTIISLLLIGLTSNVYAQKNMTKNKQATMKLNAGIITPRLAESKAFYTSILGFGVTFENDFYLLLHTPDHSSEISFLLPNHATQQPLFHAPFGGQGMYLTIEVADVDNIYEEIKKKQVDIKIALRDEPWGDRHFAIQDPNGIGIDIVQYKAPEK
jgi:catechol 2,3-dioxygenase-like lactoylglutathione lyase family enzyme